MEYWLVLVLLGFSFTLWATVGGARLVADTFTRRNRSEPGRAPLRTSLSANDVAVLIPAKNEEASIAASILSVLRQVPASSIHVIADGCTDRTAEVARAYGVHVLELTPSRGKAGGIEAAVTHFDFAERFTVLLILDADTQLDEHYVSRGLRLLDEPEVSAVAGYVYSSWRPGELSTVGRLLVSYRTRLWAVMQSMKYGQTWRYTDVTPIVPGFASMYRTRILPDMELNPPGLVIEDFNMTFELRRKRLGRVAFDPRVFGVAQDPGNFRDYYRQATRWSLGFWQTVRRHGLWVSGFSAALLVFMVESLLAAVVTILIAVAVIVTALVPLTSGAVLTWAGYSTFVSPIEEILSPVSLALLIFIPDYLLTIAVALWLRRPSLLVYGIGFPFIRLIDSIATIRGLWQLGFSRSTGRWTSPARRPVSTPAVVREHALVGAAAWDAPGPGTTCRGDQESAAGHAPSRAVAMAPRRDWSEERLVFRDSLLVGALLVLTGGLIVGGVPFTVTLATVILALPVAVLCSNRIRVDTRAARKAAP